MREMSLVPRSSSPLAQKRHIKLNEVSIASTPLLVPSFSSKGFPEVDRLIKSSAEIITDTCLVSAYDISYGLIPDNLSFAEFLFLDSATTIQDIAFLSSVKLLTQRRRFPLEDLEESC